MNTHLKNRDKFAGNLKNKEYRDALVASHITNGLSFQIRSMRLDRGWSQKELGARAGQKQGAISRLENPDYGRFTLETLKRLASACDVALLVRFAPFSEFLDRAHTIKSSDLKVVDFEHDQGIDGWSNSVTNVCSIFGSGVKLSIDKSKINVDISAGRTPTQENYG